MRLGRMTSTTGISSPKIALFSHSSGTSRGAIFTSPKTTPLPRQSLTSPPQGHEHGRKPLPRRRDLPSRPLARPRVPHLQGAVDASPQHHRALRLRMGSADVHRAGVHGGGAPHDRRRDPLELHDHEEEGPEVRAGHQSPVVRFRAVCYRAAESLGTGHQAAGWEEDRDLGDGGVASFRLRRVGNGWCTIFDINFWKVLLIDSSSRSCLDNPVFSFPIM